MADLDDKYEGLPSGRYRETEAQREADQIDLRLCQMETRAENMANRLGEPGFPDLDWYELARCISRARGRARALMHPKKREETNHG